VLKYRIMYITHYAQLNSSKTLYKNVTCYFVRTEFLRDEFERVVSASYFSST